MKTPEDVEKFMKMPCIGVIPAVNFDEIVGKDVPHNEIIAYHKPKSTITEAFRGLRTAILFSFPVNTKKSLLVTSCVPREGKTFIIANLAMVTAYSGESVLLIDADMRKPQIHAIFGLKNEKGLSNYLIGDNMEIHRSVMHENLDVITSGPVPPNPAELLGFKRMISLIEEMKDKYNTIIIDSPPLGSVTDALILSRLVEGVLFVVHGGSTTHDMSRQGATQLRDINARPIGSVLNNIEIGKENHYYSRYYQHYYHYYYYNDYYGDEEDKGKTKSKRRSHDARPSALSLLSKINRGRKDDNGRSSTWAFLRRHTPGNRKKNHKQEL